MSTLFALFLSFAPVSSATEVDAITAQAGCFHVTYESRELGTFDPDYTIRSGSFRTATTELVVAETVGYDEIWLQHVTQWQGVGENHWGQVWTKAPQHTMTYQADHSWQRTDVDSPAGKWSQYVTQVDGGPRYDCANEWEIEGGVRSWTCKTWSPVPRREYRRRDYNVLERTNKHIITHEGWVHHQMNRKLMVENGDVTPIATELTINTYDRIDDSECDGAAQHWQEQKQIWHVVRAIWKDAMNSKPTIRFHRRVNGQLLWQRLFKEVELQVQSPRAMDEFRQTIKDIITSYVI